MFQNPDENDLVSFSVHIYCPSAHCFVVSTCDSATGQSTGNSCSETDDQEKIRESLKQEHEDEQDLQK